MTEADRACFCTVCLNRKEINQKNLICGLTEKTADFETFCKDFHLDKKKKEGIIQVYKDEIVNSINKDQRFRLGNEVRLSFLVTDNDKEELTKEEKKESDYNEVIVSVTKKKKYLLLIFSFAIFIAGLFMTLMNIKIDKKYDFTNTILPFSGSLILLIIFFIEYEKFRITRQGIKRRNKLTPWHQIEFAHFKTIHSKSMTEIFLVLRTVAGDTQTIDITTCDKDATELGQIIYKFLNRFGTN